MVIQPIGFDEIVQPPYSDGARLRRDFPGFREDYLALHSLIRHIRPQTFLEIGTSTGKGTTVICRAMGAPATPTWLRGKRDTPGTSVFSIDLPPDTDPRSIYPEGEDGLPSRAGRFCRYEYVQLFGDSSVFDFSPLYPLEGWFIDGKHDHHHAFHDTLQALCASPKLIVWHDMQMPEVQRGVTEAMAPRPDYSLYRVDRSRLAFALPQSFKIPG